MQVKDIIAETRAVCREYSVSDNQIIKMLSELEARIYKETVAGYENANEFIPVEDEESILMIGKEYADVYRYYVLAKIYLNVADFESYNTYAELYAVALDSFRTNYISENMPKAVYFEY